MWMAAHPRDPNPPSAELNEEKHIEPEGVVGGHDMKRPALAGMPATGALFAEDPV
jgi:hypothetical protein